MNWQPLIDQFQSIIAYLPRVVGALAILIVGWIVARILARLTRSALQRTKLDNRLADMLRGRTAEERPADTEAAHFRVENGIASAVFYLVMIGVVILTLQVLALTQVIEPLNVFLTKIVGYLPNILGPALLLAIAWVLASVLRKVVTGGLESARVDERFRARMQPEGGAPAGGAPADYEGPEADEAGERDDEAASAAVARRASEYDEGLSLSRTIGELTYWFVFLLFLPAILGGLQLDGIMAPFADLVSEFLAFVPNLFAAAVIFAVGYFVARLLQRITASFLHSIGTDSITERAGMEEAMGKRNLSESLAMVVFALILIPVAVAALNALSVPAVTEPASAMLDDILAFLPAFFAAAAVIVIAYAAGRLVGSIVETLLAGIGFDRLPEKLGLSYEPDEDAARPSAMVGWLVFAAILVLGAIEGFATLGFETLESMTATFAVFAGKVFLGIAVFAVGLYLARLAAEAIERSGVTNASLLGNLARVSILVLVGAMALREMGIADQIINLAFGLTLGAIALAAAIAFGLGGREPAGELFQEFVDRVRGSSSGASSSTGGPGERAAGGGEHQSGRRSGDGRADSDSDEHRPTH